MRICERILRISPISREDNFAPKVVGQGLGKMKTPIVWLALGFLFGSCSSAQKSEKKYGVVDVFPPSYYPWAQQTWPSTQSLYPSSSYSTSYPYSLSYQGTSPGGHVGSSSYSKSLNLDKNYMFANNNYGTSVITYQLTPSGQYRKIGEQNTGTNSIISDNDTYKIRNNNQKLERIPVDQNTGMPLLGLDQVKKVYEKEILAKKKNATFLGKPIALGTALTALLSDSFVNNFLKTFNFILKQIASTGGGFGFLANQLSMLLDSILAEGGLTGEFLKSANEYINLFFKYAMLALDFVGADLQNVPGWSTFKEIIAVYIDQAVADNLLYVMTHVDKLIPFIGDEKIQQFISVSQKFLVDILTDIVSAERPAGYSSGIENVEEVQKMAQSIMGSGLASLDDLAQMVGEQVAGYNKGPENVENSAENVEKSKEDTSFAAFFTTVLKGVASDMAEDVKLSAKPPVSFAQLFAEVHIEGEGLHSEDRTNSLESKISGESENMQKKEENNSSKIDENSPRKTDAEMPLRKLQGTYADYLINPQNPTGTDDVMGRLAGWRNAYDMRGSQPGVVSNYGGFFPTYPYSHYARAQSGDNEAPPQLSGDQIFNLKNPGYPPPSPFYPYFPPGYKLPEWFSYYQNYFQNYYDSLNGRNTQANPSSPLFRRLAETPDSKEQKSAKTRGISVEKLTNDSSQQMIAEQSSSETSAQTSAPTSMEPNAIEDYFDETLPANESTRPTTDKTDEDKLAVQIVGKHADFHSSAKRLHRNQLLWRQQSGRPARVIGELLSELEEVVVQESLGKRAKEDVPVEPKSNFLENPNEVTNLLSVYLEGVIGLDRHKLGGKEYLNLQRHFRGLADLWADWILTATDVGSQGMAQGIPNLIKGTLDSVGFLAGILNEPTYSDFLGNSVNLVTRITSLTLENVQKNLKKNAQNSATLKAQIAAAIKNILPQVHQRTPKSFLEQIFQKAHNELR